MSCKNKDKTLIILDLDETLVCASETTMARKADFMVFDYHVYKGNVKTIMEIQFFQKNRKDNP